ncbi:MAG: amidase family protein, partial [Vicinamibacteria bacterium]
MMDLCYLPAWQLAERIRRGDLSPVELVAATLERIERCNPDLLAYTSVRAEAAREDARTLEWAIAEKKDVGPLAGLPLAVKDHEDVAGMVTSHGSVPYKHNLAARDSVQVARLRSAGAIVIGKTNLPEFGYTAISKNRLFGVSRNPWDAGRTPGGSSGGSAAAVASG